MQIVNIAYRRTYNLGNYESEALEIEAVLAEGEIASECLPKLKAWCEKNRSQVPAKPSPPVNVVPQSIGPAGKAHLEKVITAAQKLGYQAEMKL